jgi:hypothetical protein
MLRTSGNLFRIGKLDQANSAASENEVVRGMIERFQGQYESKGIPAALSIFQG